LNLAVETESLCSCWQL